MKQYTVFDTQGPLLADISVFAANNSRHALQQYLDGEGQGQTKFERRGDNRVRWMVQEVVIDGSRKYGRGRRIWYGEIKPEVAETL